MRKNIILQNVENVVLKVANKIYASHHLTIKNEYKQLTNSLFRSESEVVNFDQASEAVNLINKWCSDNTNNKINQMVGNSKSTEEIKTMFTYYNYLRKIYLGILEKKIIFAILK